jgi:hypothetical protein
MATNRTRDHHYNQKNNISVFSVEHVPYTYLTEDGGEGSIFAVLPPHSILVHVLVIEEETTTANAKFDITVGGVAVITNGQLDANGLIGSNQLDNVHMEEGGDLIIKQGSTAPTSGEFTFCILYIEHLKHNGEYTRFSNA